VNLPDRQDLVTVARLGRRYLERRLGVRRPLFLSWYVTGRCTQRCRGCVFFERFAGQDDELSAAEARDVVAQLGALHLPVLLFVGGEPLLRPDLADLVAGARQQGIQTGLFTNGAPLTPGLARRLSSSLDVLIVSLDGFGAGHDRIRGRGSFARAWQGLLVYRDHRVRSGARLYANVGLHRGNLDSVDLLLDELLAAGVDRIKFQPNFIREYKPDPAAAVALIDRIEARWDAQPERILGDRQYFADLRTYFSRADNRAFCGGPTLAHLALMPDGGVSACCDFPLPLGSLREAPLARILRRDHAATLARASACHGCVRRDYQIVREIFEPPPWRVTPRALRSLLGF